MSAQERDEHVSTGPSNARGHSNKTRCLLFIIIVFIFPISLFFILPYFLVFTQFAEFILLSSPILLGLAICLGLMLLILVIDTHPNWRQAIRHHFLGSGDSYRFTRRQVTQTTSSRTQYSFDENASWTISKPGWLSSSSNYKNNKIWPTDILPMATVIQRLPKLESLVDELQGLIDSSSLQFNTMDDRNREALLIKQEATNQLLASLRTHFSKKTISLDFFLQKRKHLMETLQNIKTSLDSHSGLEKTEHSSLEELDG